MPGPGKLPHGPTRDFVEFLHVQYDRAGQPSARRVSKAIFKLPKCEAVSHETVSVALRGKSVPSWEKVRSIATALAQMSVRPISEADTDRLIGKFHELWIAARQPPDESSPAVDE
jgi:uncharacterized protein with NRDE domain